MNISKKLLWQHGSLAQYAEIDLDVDSSGNETHVIVPDHISAHWSSAIRFAVDLFIESFAWRDRKFAQMTVTIQSIKAVPCDTTICSLAYVTFQAVCSAWNVDGEQIFIFDQSSGRYSICLSSQA